MALMARKTKDEAYKPEAWVYEEFHHLCPDGEKLERTYYLSLARRIAGWLGPLNRPVATKAPTLVDTILLIAGHGMQIMEGANFRAWTAYQNLLEMQRALYLRALVIGAGTFTARHVLTRKRDHKRWTPLTENGVDFFGVEMPVKARSKVTIGSAEMEQAVFYRLFGDELIGLTDRMAMLAVVDAFRNAVDDGNPITSSLRRGLRKALLKYQILPTGALGEWVREWHPRLANELAVRVENGEMLADEDQLAELRRMSPAKRIATSVRTAFARGEIKISCPGAPFHGVEGRSHVVWPAGLETLAQNEGWIDAGELAEVFEENKWVEVSESGEVSVRRYDVVGEQKGETVRKARLKLARLAPEGVAALFGKDVPENPTIDPESGVDTDTNSSI